MGGIKDAHPLETFRKDPKKNGERGPGPGDLVMGPGYPGRGCEGGYVQMDAG